MTFLRVEGLSKRYASANGDGTGGEALAGFSLTVDEGAFVVLLGPSGCGKTTLLQIVAGLETPTAGRVLLRGAALQGWSRERALVFQEGNLFPWLTAGQNVAFGLRLQGVPAAERLAIARETLARLGLRGVCERYPHELSGGMQQRVAIARALAVDPEVLLLDEPFAAVDAPTRGQLQEELLRLWRETGKTVLFVTHNIREALLLAERIVLLTPRPGRVQADLRVDLEHPRRAHSAALAAWEARIEGMMGELATNYSL